MLDEKTILSAAARLHTAEKTRKLIRQFTLDYPDITIDDAYAIQNAWIRLKLSEGRVLKGRKIGLTSRAMQAAVNINEPDYGALLHDMFYRDGGEIPTDRFIAPRVEVELAFILSKPLSGPECTIFDVLKATDFVVPALEILDARIQRVDPETKATRKVIDTISDNAANAALVLGGQPFKPLGVDMRWISALCFRNGQIEESGVAAAVLNHPANGIAWLANKLAPHGVGLEPGQVILSGSFIRPVDARKGDTFHADYSSFGCVSCYFA
jgi:2-oxo-hept-3-ene-1,7-dioate hydratase